MVFNSLLVLTRVCLPTFGVWGAQQENESGEVNLIRWAFISVLVLGGVFLLILRMTVGGRSCGMSLNLVISYSVTNS